MRKLEIYDVLAAVGILLIGAGLYMVSPPVALCIVGGILLVLGVVGAARGGGR